MFGAFESPGEGAEHNLIPPLKLIDFGDARDLNEPRERQMYLNQYYKITSEEIRRREGRASPRVEDTDRDGDVQMPDQDEELGEDDLMFASPEREPMGDDRATSKNIYDIGKVSFIAFGETDVFVVGLARQLTLYKRRCLNSLCSTSDSRSEPGT